MKIVGLIITVSLAAIISYVAADVDSGFDGSNIKTDSGLEGKPVDISPWIYVWRSDRKIQEKPEADFLPKIIDRVNTVYRPFYHERTYEERKSYYYDQRDLMMEYPEKSKGKLLTGAIWISGLHDFNFELIWPEDKKIPSPESIDVRIYPTSFGWFGWTVERILGKPKISADNRSWIYNNDLNGMMDAEYSMHLPAATEVIAVYAEDESVPVPEIKLTGNDIGKWDKMDIEIEWGFDKEKKKYDGKAETFIAEIETIRPLDSDSGTEIAGKNKWKTSNNGDDRRGLAMTVLYAPNSLPGFDSRITVRNGKDGFTFRLVDLEKGPIYIPVQGVFISKAGSGISAKRFMKELADKGTKSFRELTREHSEVKSWDELMENVRFWQCPDNIDVPPFPQTKEPAVYVSVPDQRMTDLWRTASDQLRGNHCWGMLSHEVGRVVRSMEFVGLHDYTMSVYDYFLRSPGIKPDGDYSTGKGALEWATSMKHDVGFSHEGTHASTGRIMFAIAERYFLTGDKEYLRRNSKRLQDAADWIINERRSYMSHVPNRKDLFVCGLMPPQMLGDYSLPASDRRWFYCDNALNVQGLRRFAEALTDIDPKAGKKYLAEAESYSKDLLRVIEKEILYAPVKLGSDGMYHYYLPRIAYNAGLSGIETGAPMFPDADMFWGALPVAEQFAAIDANDPRIIDTLNIMDDQGILNPESGDIGSASEKLAIMPGQGGMSESGAKRISSRGKSINSYIDSLEKFNGKRHENGMSVDDAWFWKQYALMPKISHNASIFLLQDDIPNFLRFWMNSFAGLVAKDGRFWEWSTPTSYEVCTYPDTMSAGWFIENFRNLLVTEIDDELWIGRGIPRAWLEHGKKVVMKNAPTYFGDVDFEIESDMANGRISAVIDMPERRVPKNTMIRFRHPDSKPIKSVMVNGEPWTEFDAAKECVILKKLKGIIKVDAIY